GELALAQAALYLAVAPKSNAVYTAFGEAQQDVRERPAESVPLHIRNAPTRLMQDLGYGRGYQYAHDAPDAQVEQEHLPEALRGGNSRDGRWLTGGDPLGTLAAEARVTLPAADATGSVKKALVERAGSAPVAGAPLAHLAEAGGLPTGLRRELDVVFIMLHGPYGEDGTIQGVLELADLPYVGAGVTASAVGMDKAAMKGLFRAHGLPVVEYVVVLRREWRARPAAVAARLATAPGFPCF